MLVSHHYLVSVLAFKINQSMGKLTLLWAVQGGSIDYYKKKFQPLKGEGMLHETVCYDEIIKEAVNFPYDLQTNKD
jgi:hypothetical protein